MKIYIVVLLVALVQSDTYRLLNEKSNEPATTTALSEPAKTTPTEHENTKSAEETHSATPPTQTHETANNQPTKTDETSPNQNKASKQTNTSEIIHPSEPKSSSQHPTDNNASTTSQPDSPGDHPADHTVNTDNKPGAPYSEHPSPTPVQPESSTDHPINTDTHKLANDNSGASTPALNEKHDEPKIDQPLPLELSQPTEVYNIQNDAIIQEIMKTGGLKDKEEIKQELKVEEEEVQAQKQENTKLQEQLDAWIVKQKHEFQESEAFHIAGERFEFVLKAEQVYSFWYDTTTNKPGNDLHIDIAVYVEMDKSFYTPTRPQESTSLQFVIVSAQNRVLIEKDIYITWSTEFRPPERTGYHLNFVNNYGLDIMVLVNLERMNKTVQSINSHLDPLVSTLSTAVEEMEKNYNEEIKYSYKSEMGFKERQEEHMATLLMLTGIELLAVTTTAIIQMFCLRNLLDNRSIV